MKPKSRARQVRERFHGYVTPGKTFTCQELEKEGIFPNRRLAHEWLDKYRYTVIEERLPYRLKQNLENRGEWTLIEK